LQLDLSITLKKEAIEKIPLFAQHEEDFLEEVAIHLKPEIATPDDYIFKEGDEGKKVYFVIAGELEVLSGDEEKIISILKEGDFFGEIALFKNVTRTASVKAVTYCDLYSLSKARFDYVLEKFPKIKQKISEVADSRNN
jgi:CRP-like cAMP-binding protein